MYGDVSRFGGVEYMVASIAMNGDVRIIGKREINPNANPSLRQLTLRLEKPPLIMYSHESTRSPASRCACFKSPAVMTTCTDRISGQIRRWSLPPSPARFGISVIIVPPGLRNLARAATQSVVLSKCSTTPKLTTKSKVDCNSAGGSNRSASTTLPGTSARCRISLAWSQPVGE